MNEKLTVYQIKFVISKQIIIINVLDNQRCL